jgi:glycosyltransferase involved in cell wall biosynthesis
MKPAVSVVTPVWNAAATLAETVASVRAQGFEDWELILVDDASTDGTPELARALADPDPRIRILTLAENGGPAAARNAGIRAARGRYIAFVDADDLWRPQKLARQIGFMRAEGHALTFSAYRRIAADGRPLGIVRPPARVDRAELLKGNVIGCLTAVYDSAAVGRLEMPPIRRRQDYGLWLAILARVPHAHALPEVLADYRVHTGSLSADKLGAVRATWALYRDVERLSRPRAAFYFAHNLAGALVKRRR